MVAAGRRQPAARTKAARAASVPRAAGPRRRLRYLRDLGVQLARQFVT